MPEGVKSPEDCQSREERYREICRSLDEGNQKRAYWEGLISVSSRCTLADYSSSLDAESSTASRCCSCFLSTPRPLRDRRLCPYQDCEASPIDIKATSYPSQENHHGAYWLKARGIEKGSLDATIQKAILAYLSYVRPPRKHFIFPCYSFDKVG
jgi:hypothetical protein